MSILWTLLIGFVVGLVARFLKPGRQKLGFILTTVLGIVGAFVGSFLGQTLGLYQPGEAAGFIMSVIGAIIVLAIWGLVSKSK
ncbi:GlsB/YeaQ/YmgE family stress response membrane protein [uncultured Aquimonas sp.]|uniref:GlsB/YeaQ/YmgE family stress response membrane protein n=1 Tax=uncultured Aquimonas sp. TaxID=385483 RepID=UPI0008686D29|nr:GlsB/YeaQ/YmgE family stress response membrane protein [uncultured Aquimonas sp.]ODU44996.1 MAG: transglycosylase [Xanthomonadaceae bacterium SCN 69-123]